MRPLIHMVGGGTGSWTVDEIRAVTGEALQPVPRLDVTEAPPGPGSPGPGSPGPESSARWVLRGFGSNQRYTTRAEDTALRTVQAGLSRPEATRAALIPITKTAAWWAMPQDERRAVFEDRSHHTAVGLQYLPGVARRLTHCRDLGEPFDFLTWFEYAPEHEAAFDELLRRLRGTEEWGFVERECEVRLRRA